MVKFVGVIPKEDVKSVLTSPTVDGHFPLVIEPDDLIMMMALEDEFKLTRHQIKKKDQNAFLRNYQKNPITSLKFSQISNLKSDYFKLFQKSHEYSKINEIYLFGNLSEQILSKIRKVWYTRFLQGIS